MHIQTQLERYYLDITTSRKDLDEARKEAIERGKQDGRRIVALYNSKRDQTVSDSKLMRRYSAVTENKDYNQVVSFTKRTIPGHTTKDKSKR